MSINFLFALLGGFGAFWLVVAPSIIARGTQKDGAPGTFARLTQLSETGNGSLVYTGNNFIVSVRKNGLSVALGKAKLDITPAAFVRTCLLLGVGTAAAGFLLIGNLLAGLFIGAGAIFMYVNWLYTRRDKKVLEYDEALADMCDRLSAGATLKNTLIETLNHAALLAPPILKDDFSQIANDTSTKSGIKNAFQKVQAVRNSYALDMLADVVTTWDEHGTVVPLAEVLYPLSSTLRDLASEQRMMMSRISGARSQLLLTTFMPWGYVILLRSMMPGYRELFSQPIGTILLIIAFCVSAGGYLFGEKQVSILRQTLDLNGGK